MIRLNGFQLGHLLVWRFYSMLWAAIRYATTGRPTLFYSRKDGGFLGVGGGYPDQELWDAGYEVRCCGQAFGALILRYSPPPKRITIGLQLPVPISRWRQLASAGVFTIALMMFGGYTANAQTADCPPDKVCLSRAAAEKAVETVKELDATKVQLAAEKQAVEDLRKELNEMRVKFAEVSGELSGIKQNAVQDRAIIEMLLKSVKRKCLPLSVCIAN